MTNHNPRLHALLDRLVHDIPLAPWTEGRHTRQLLLTALRDAYELGLTASRGALQTLERATQEAREKADERERQ